MSRSRHGRPPTKWIVMRAGSSHLRQRGRMARRFSIDETNNLGLRSEAARCVPLEKPSTRKPPNEGKNLTTSRIRSRRALYFDAIQSPASSCVTSNHAHYRSRRDCRLLSTPSNGRVEEVRLADCFRKMAHEAGGPPKAGGGARYRFCGHGLRIDGQGLQRPLTNAFRSLVTLLAG